ncbi:pentapeptide repeat-containing protein, partial [Leisingera sp. F5]|uniref:pentapeptide repeat-containing protein n=1 Tax=Leisingera sp. F5 TaxID=1813816 RepID=UPI000A5FD9E0
SFKNSVLLEGGNFNGCIFKEHVDFDGCIFRGRADFSWSRFDGDVSLVGGDFCGVLSFEDVRAAGGFDLSYSKLKKDLVLDGATIKDADCSYLSVAGSIEASATQFVRKVTFHRAKVDGDANFFESSFGPRSKFSYVVFHGFANFPDTFFSEFSHSIHSEVDFSGCSFEKPANFNGARFSGAYPIFHGSILHEQTTFSANPRLWPEGEELLSEYARNSCATIRHLLAKQGLPEDEHFFFRREMHFAGRIGSIWQRLPYLLFGLFSEYGYSILRPTLWLLGVWALGFAAFWGYFSGCCVLAPDSVIERPMGSAMALSLSNLFPLFGFGRTFLLEELKALPAVLQFFSGFQTVASLPLLFFLGLGLRQRFRLR